MNVSKLYFFIIILAAVGFTACKNGTQKEVPGDTEADSAVVTSNRPVYDRLLAELDSTEIYDDNILYGYWFKPHEACAVNIFFHKDNTYEFKNYEVDKDDSIIEILEKGKYTQKGEIITLDSSDGYFKSVILYKYDGTNHYLTDDKGELYLVKGSD